MARCDVYKCDRCGIYVEKAVTVRAANGRGFDGVENFTKYIGFDVCTDCALIIFQQWSNRLAKKHTEVALELINENWDDFNVSKE